MSFCADQQPDQMQRFAASSTNLLDAAPTADGDLGVGLPLHALLRVAAGPDDQPDEVGLRVLPHWDEDLALLLARPARFQMRSWSLLTSGSDRVRYAQQLGPQTAQAH